MAKNESVASFSINVLRRNIVLLLIIVLAGNLIVFFNSKDDKPYFKSIIKIHTRGIYYDHIKDLSNKLADTSFYRNPSLLGLTDEENNSLQSISALSYRNEDLYIYEIGLNFIDSLNWHSVKQKVYSYLQNETELKDIYFKRADNILLLNRQIAAAERNLNSRDTTSGDNEKVVKSIDLLTKKNMNSYMNDMLVKEIEVLPLDYAGLSFVQENKLKSQLRATIIFFIIALFACVIREQFRKENKN